MRRKFICVICCALVLTSGCGSNSIPTSNSVVTDTENNNNDSIDSNDEDMGDDSAEFEEEDVYDEDAEVDAIQQKFLKAVQDNSGSELYDISVDKNVTGMEPDDIDSEKDMQESLEQLKTALHTLYGSDVQIDYEQSTFEEFDIAKLQEAADYEDEDDTGKADIDTIESLNKTVGYVIDSKCNLQRCIKSDMTFVLSGSNGEDTQTVPSFIYKVDDQYFMDTMPLYCLLEEQETAVKKRKQNITDYSTSEYDRYKGMEDDDEDLDYSSLLLKRE